MSDSCYNHDNVRAVFRCFDCKPDIVVKFCKECHEHVHSLQVFRLHKTQPIEKVEQRKLSQDVSDLETLVAVENDLLKDVITTLEYTEQQEREMLREVVIKTEKRLHDIQQCHEKVNKAIHYLNKVSSVIKLCSDYNHASHEVSSSMEMNMPTSDLKPALDEAQEHISGTSALPVEFPVVITSSLNKKGGFWMTRSDSAGLKKVAQIENKLRELFSTKSLCACSSPIKEGTICIASNPIKTDFWRVRVEKLCKDQLVTVHYLDHGQQENIPISSIFDIPLAVKQIPYQAMECCLFPYSDKVSLPYEAKWCFKDLIYGKDIKARICSKVIFPEGNALFHVQLTSIGPPPVNINQKVADLILQQQLNQQDQPILPKEEASHQSRQTEECKTTISHEDASSRPAEQVNVSIATAVSHDQMNKGQAGTSAILESKDSTSFGAAEQISNASQPVVSPNEQIEKPPVVTILTKANADSLLSDAFQSPRNNSKDSKEPPHEAISLMNVPEYVPIGFLNEQMYDRIFKECKANFTGVKSMVSYARFFIIQVDDFQLAEAMKTKIWCCLDDALCKNINKAYKDQTSKGNKYSVFLVFLSKLHIVGLARVTSQCQTSPHCTVVGRGLLWSHCCHGEFCLELFNATKLPIKLLDSDVFVRQFLRENVVGRELKWEKGFAIIQKYEKIRRKTSVLDDACRMYRKDMRKDLVSSQEHLNEEEQKVAKKGKHKVHNSESSSLDKDVDRTQNDLRRKSIDKEFMAERREEKVQDIAENEDWDLEAEPVRETTIYFNSSSTTAASCESSAGSGVADLQKGASEDKEESKVLYSSESEALTECTVNESSSASVRTEVKNLERREEDVPRSVSVPNGSRNSNENVSSEAQQNEEASETNAEVVDEEHAKKTPQKDFDGDGATISFGTETQQIQQGTKEDEAEVDEGENGERDSFVEVEVPKNGEEEVVTRKSEDESFESDEGKPEAVEIQAQDETLESSESSSGVGRLDPEKPITKAVEQECGRTESVPERGDILDVCSTQHADVGNGASNDVKGLPFPQERCPSYFLQVLQTSESQPDERDFYVVNPPVESHPTEASSSLYEASGPHNEGIAKENRQCKAERDVLSEKVELVNSSQDPAGITSSQDGGSSRDVETEEDIRASPEPIDNNPSSYSSPERQSISAAASSSDWLTTSTDVMCDKESLDEEVIAFLPVKPGIEYRVIMMSEPNEDNVFWARIYRNDEEERAFKQFCKRMNAAAERRDEKLSSVFVMKNCCLKMRKHIGVYRRVLIKKLLGNGKVLVQNVDLGYTSELQIDDLRELDSEFQIVLPPQAFECRILNELSKKDKMKFSKVSPRNNKRGLSIELEIHVKAISGEIAEVDILRVHQLLSNY